VKRELNLQGKGHLGIQGYSWKQVTQSKHEKRGFISGRGKEMRHSVIRVEEILLQFTFSSERREEEDQTTVFRALPEMKMHCRKKGGKGRAKICRNKHKAEHNPSESIGANKFEEPWLMQEGQLCPKLEQKVIQKCMKSSLKKHENRNLICQHKLGKSLTVKVEQTEAS
jgi:hypothetical protein